MATYDYVDLCIGARLQLDGKSVDLSRRKRRVGSLVGPDGEALPEDLILPALGGLTEEVYRALELVRMEASRHGWRRGGKVRAYNNVPIRITTPSAAKSAIGWS